MTSGSDTQQPAQISKEEAEESLKYLEFVQAMVLQTALYFSRVYGYAKENAGPLKPGVLTMEGTVKTVVGPVYDKFHDVPLELLKIVDRKVDQSVHEVERHVPPRIKEAYAAAQKAPEIARSMAGEFQRAGVTGATAGVAKAAYAKWEPVARGLYAKYEPTAEQYAVSAWRSLNRLPLVPKVTQVVMPTAAQLSERYNQAVCSAAERGYTVSAYLPLVPTEKIAKVFGSDGTTSSEVPAQ